MLGPTLDPPPSSPQGCWFPRRTSTLFFLKDRMSTDDISLHFTFPRSTLEKLLKHDDPEVRDIADAVVLSDRHQAPIRLIPLEEEGTVTPLFRDQPGEVQGTVVHLDLPPAKGEQIPDLREPRIVENLYGFRFVSSPFLNVSCECGWLVVDGHPYRKLSWKERIQLFLHLRSVSDLRLNPAHSWKQPPNDLH